MSWENLLPACKKCNTTKGNHDTKTEPIINPFVDNPKDYLYIQNYRYRPLNNNQLGRTTIDVLALNDDECFGDRRYEIGKGICAILEDIYDDKEKMLNPKLQNKYLKKIKKLLSKGSRKKEYSALVSTIILSDESFQYIENLLKENSLWDDEFEELKQELVYCALLK